MKLLKPLFDESLYHSTAFTPELELWHPESVELWIVDNSTCVANIIKELWFLQEQKLFAKEPKLVKLFRGLNSMPIVLCHKKVHFFFSYVCNAKFAKFWCFAVG